MASTSAACERRLRSSAPEATEALGRALGAAVAGGTVIALDGDLGAGKTTFVRGLARGLGIEGTIASPTYTLMDAHEAGARGLPLYHFDAWMEGREKALFQDGGDEWLFGSGVAVVEWAGRVEQWLPAVRLELEFGHVGEERRSIRLRVPPAAGPLRAALAQIVRELGLPEGIEADSGAPENRPGAEPSCESDV